MWLRRLRFVRAVRVVAVGWHGCWASRFRQRRRQPAPAAQAQDVRDELDKLRKEFEAIRDAYGARLAALESKLTAIGAPGVPAAPAQTVGSHPRHPPRRRPASRSRPAPPARAVRPARCRSTGTRRPPVEDFFSNPDMAVIANFVGAAGKNDVNPPTGAALERVEVSFQAIVDPYARADFFLGVPARGARGGRRFHDFTRLPGGLLTKVGRERAVRQGQHHAQPHAAMGGSRRC